MKLRQKLVFGFIAIALLYGVVGYVAIRHSTYVGTIFSAIERAEIPALTSLIEMKAAARQASIKAMEYSLRGDESSKLKSQEAVKKLGEHLERFSLAEEGEKKIQRLISEKVKDFQVQINEYLAVSAGLSPETFIKEEEVHKARKELIQTLYTQIEKEQRELDEAATNIQEAINDTIRITLFAAFGVICLAIGSGLFISYSISTPIIKLKNAAVEIGKGNFLAETDIRGKDEIAELAASFNHMVKGLKELDKLKIDRNDLEIMVAKRTAEMEEAMAVLENGTLKLNKSQTAMLYMVEDLNRQSQKLRDAQDAIVRSEKMAAIGQLASSVAHELRNPLGVMKNVVYYFNMLELGKENNDIKENLEILAKEIEHSDKIITDILEFSRIKKPSLRPENINMILEETLKRLEINPEVKVIKELDDTLPEIEIDARQVQQVFFNIAQNAVHAMDKAGRLNIRTGLNDGFIQTSFSDTGLGIAAEDLEKIFDPLFSNKINGTGLGLSVCASFVEGHGGKIEVESEVGRGSTFTVKFPVNRG